MFASVINSRLTNFLNDNRILNETQSGFRKEYSTIDNIMALYSLIEYYKSKKTKTIFCFFVDFTKAFDNIWRVGLWQKLLKHGIEGKFFNIIIITNTCKWILYIEKILQDVGLNYIRLSNIVTNINWLCKEVQNRLQMKYQVSQNT